jgi:transposase
LTFSGGEINLKKHRKMATVEQYQKMTTRERRTRYFSTDFKKRKVSEIERNLVSISEVSREYQVSLTSVYRWIYKYSKMRKKQEKQVVESQSDTRKLAELRQKIKELEQMLGQKEAEVMILNKMIELTEEETGLDIKKKGLKASFGSGPGKKA